MEKMITKKQIDGTEYVHEILLSGKITDVEYVYSYTDYPDAIVIEITKPEGKKYVEIGADIADVTDKSDREREDNPFYMKVEGPDIKKFSDLTDDEKNEVLEKVIGKYCSAVTESIRIRGIEKKMKLPNGVTPFADAFMKYAEMFRTGARNIIKSMKDGDAGEYSQALQALDAARDQEAVQ